VIALPVPAAVPSSIDQSKLPVVHAFLQSLYPASSPPRVELTPYTVECLSSLAEHVRASDERAALLEEGMLQAAREYTAEAARMEAALARVGVRGKEDLSEQAQQHLTQLVDLAHMLALKNVEPVTYACGLIAARDSYHDSVARLRAAQAALQSSQARSAQQASLLASLRRLARSMSSMRARASADAQAKLKQLPYFAAKKAEYERERDSLSSALQRAGWDESLSHEALVALAAEVRALEERDIAPLDQALAPFAALPPDLTLAHVRVAAARQELAELEQDFTLQVQQMHEPLA